MVDLVWGSENTGLAVNSSAKGGETSAPTSTPITSRSPGTVSERVSEMVEQPVVRLVQQPMIWPHEKPVKCRDDSP